MNEKIDLINLEEGKPDRKKGAENLVIFLKKLDLLKVLADSDKKREIFGSVDIENLKSWLKRLNGIMTEKPIKDREIYQEGTVISNPIDGKPLAIAASGQMQTLMFEKHFAEALPEIEVEYIPDFTAISINLIHMFSDGNGRLSRLIYFLLSNDSNKSEEEIEREIIELLETSTDKYNFNPGLIYPTLNHILLKDTPNLKHTPIPNMYRRTPKKEELFDNPLKYSIAIAEMMEEDPITSDVASKNYIQQITDDSNFYMTGNGSKLKIDSLKILKSTEDPQKGFLWLSTYENVKRWRYNILIDIYKNPERYMYKDKNITVRDYIRDTVLKNQKETQD